MPWPSAHWPPKGFSWADLGTVALGHPSRWPCNLVEARVGRHREACVPGSLAPSPRAAGAVASVLRVCFHKTRTLDQPRGAHSMVPAQPCQRRLGTWWKRQYTGPLWDPRGQKLWGSHPWGLPLKLGCGLTPSWSLPGFISSPRHPLCMRRRGSGEFTPKCHLHSLEGHLLLVP